MTPICVLRSGGEFKPEHVQWLAGQVPGLVCLSDSEVQGVETIKLRYDWPKWWAKLEMFSDAVDDDLMFYDLDTVVLRPLKAQSQTTVLQDFFCDDRIGSGLMYIKRSDKAPIWDSWIANPAGHMMRCGNWGDQWFLNGRLGNAQRWQSIAPVYSYKGHCKEGLPDDAAVVCFHGKPRPWDVRKPWIPQLKGGE